MSVRVMTWVWEHSPVGGSDLLMMLAIADCANDDGANAWPSVATLARKCRIDERTVQRVIRRLVTGGHLMVAKQGGGRGTNVYRVVIDELSTPPAICHPGSLPPVASAPPHPRRSSVTAAPAQLRHPNVLEPSKNRPTRTRGAALPSTGATCTRHLGQPAHACAPCRSERIGANR
jgi:hypothetical protein